MAQWLPSIEGLDTIHIEASRARDSAHLARLAPVGRSPLTRLAEALRARFEDRRELTDHPCRLPDGRTGRTAIRKAGGEWVAVCVRPRATSGDASTARLRPEAAWASRGW